MAGPATSDDKDIFRCGIVIGGVSTTVSMDGRFAFYLAKKLGSKERVKEWIRASVRHLELEWSNSSSESGNIKVRANTGLSRAIQREALDYLLGDLQWNHEEISDGRQD